jgi:polysaccharide deacetylase 2 family uncharacterized protein YibQ
MSAIPATWQLLFVLWLGCGMLAVSAAEPVSNTYTKPLPAIALIIDDMGNRREAGRRVVSLPGPVACAFLPYGQYTDLLARQAHARNKEVLLHLPMQAVEPAPDMLGQGVLTLDMTEQQFLATLDFDIAAVPHLSGLNNHMGSLLTRHPGTMAWLMEAIAQRGNLFFVDSRTTSATVAEQLAVEHGIPNTSRNVFLDNEPNPAAVRAQFRKLVAMARLNGTALGIGHPYPGTLAVLADELRRLDQSGVQLISVSRLIERQQQGRSSWQASLSR